MNRIRSVPSDIRLLTELLFPPRPANHESAAESADLDCLTPQTRQCVAAWHSFVEEKELRQLESLAKANHVVLRTFLRVGRILDALGNKQAAAWVRRAVEREQSRINNALIVLDQICAELKNHRCPVTVIKSLDHWPDLGSDLDLYTDADATTVKAFMVSRFHASVAPQSWGDRLANKWNFRLPGLPELVEVHAGRLGQMGEHVLLTRSLSAGSRYITRNALQFRVPAPEDQIILSTLQRMYRHFYIRLCDLADIGQLLSANVVDFSRLRSVSSAAGIWEGVATYLTIVSQCVEAHTGCHISLPSWVCTRARFRANHLRYRNSFLRVPILPHSLGLYAREMKSFLQRRDLPNSLRLGLLPCLATAAAVEQRVTGSDKGIW